MKTIILSAVLLSLVACKDERTEVTTAPVIKDVKQASLDIIYASQDAYMHDGPVALDSIIPKMQTVLQAWPERDKTNAQPCFMLLRNETTRMLNLKDGLSSNGIDNKDYKFECRQSINYNYDQNRTHEFWKSI